MRATLFVSTIFHPQGERSPSFLATCTETSRDKGLIDSLLLLREDPDCPDLRGFAKALFCEAQKVMGKCMVMVNG